MKLFVFLCILFIQVYFSLSLVSIDDPQVSISTGLVKGKTISFRGIEVNQFLGIPFAESPTGPLRFKKPISKKPWKGVLNADQWGPVCSQPALINSKQNNTEDCLYLNVFETSSTLRDLKNGLNNLRPVMVWIHGGGWVTGSANIPEWYDGTVLASMNDVVVVSINYRLGVFGYLYLPEYDVPGNMGLWDQQLALKWVQENIRFFGGDPSKVTIFGESAGSFAVSVLLVSPQSRGLFNRAIMQSGTIHDSALTQRPNSSIHFLEALNCSSTISSCLASYEYGVDPKVDGIYLLPVIGDEFIPDTPVNMINNHGVDPNISILLGTVGYEGAGFMAANIDPILFDPFHPGNLTLDQVRKSLDEVLILRDYYSVDYVMEKYFSNVNTNDSDELRLILAKAGGDMLISCPTYVFGRDLVKNGQSNVFAYYQTQKPRKSMFGFADGKTWVPVTHADDIPFVFGHSMQENSNCDPEELIISNIMMKAWTHFARYGKPGLIGADEWPSWSMNDGENILHPTIDFNSKKIGHYDQTPVDFCFENWPFPVAKK
ncbi:acetylcholinesterase-like [Panonychus citri]|uniref:acetylcholinesterase-like n=1 Tax=Panonychus citri TaxID=50023 RepID=UPI0023081372|nr:acetylcholinesterase-like [Panonychus citri]